MIDPDRRPRTRGPLALPLLALVLALAGCAPAPALPVSSAGVTPANVQHLAADQVDTWHGMHYDGLVLDVRSGGEWDDDLGHMIDATLVPIAELELRLGEFSRYQGKAVLVYDRTGTSVVRAGQILVMHGFRDVSVLDGGLKSYRDWQTKP